LDYQHGDCLPVRNQLAQQIEARGRDVDSQKAEIQEERALKLARDLG